jgi:hypothetical protein
MFELAEAGHTSLFEQLIACIISTTLSRNFSGAMILILLSSLSIFNALLTAALSSGRISR